MTNRFRGFPEEGIHFLAALKRHNDRSWFDERKNIYLETVKAPMESLILTISQDLQQFAPEMIANPKVSAYRIYRDTRFSPDKRPFKTHTAAVFPHRGLGKHEGAGFYVHIASDEVFVGGGLFRPSSQDLLALREYLAVHHRTFRSVIEAPRFRKYFGEITGERLTRPPRGFPKDHPAVDLLRLKQFLASRAFEPEFAASDRFYGEIIRTFKALLPVVQFLNEPIVRRRRHSGRSATCP